ncbi:MAG: hypothetical protein U0R64_01115 [Candidatus Nanopelagicales bacterium]
MLTVWEARNVIVFKRSAARRAAPGCETPWYFKGNSQMLFGDAPGPGRGHHPRALSHGEAAMPWRDQGNTASGWPPSTEASPGDTIDSMDDAGGRRLRGVAREAGGGVPRRLQQFTADRPTRRRPVSPGGSGSVVVVAAVTWCCARLGCGLAMNVSAR